MIDSHCHLDAFVRNDELDAVLERAAAAGVNAFVAAGTNAEDREVYRGLAEKFPGKIFYAAGLHPTELGEDFEEQLAALEAFFAAGPRPAPVAVGEIGLDGHWLPKDAAEAERVRARQREVFARQLALAKKCALPVVVHARDAFREAVETIDASGVDWRRVVFHCFAEGADEMREIFERGGRASFTGTLTYKNAENVRAAALAQAKITAADLDTVEIVGGGMRLPLVQEELSRVRGTAEAPRATSYLSNLRRASKNVLYTWLNARAENLAHNEAAAETGTGAIERPIKRSGYNYLGTALALADTVAMLGVSAWVHRRLT